MISKSNLSELGFPIARFSEEKLTNNAGHRLMDMCNALDIHVANGRCGLYTCIGRQTCKI